MQRVIEFFDEDDERTNVRVVQSGARIVPLKLFDEPARIINADEELIVRRAAKTCAPVAQFARRSSRQFAQLRATRAIDDAIFEIDADLRVSALKKSLDLAEKRFVHSNRRTASSSSRLSSSIGELVEREAHVAKTIGQSFKDIVQLAPTRRRVRRDKLKIGAADLLVKFESGAPRRLRSCVFS